MLHVSTRQHIYDNVEMDRLGITAGLTFSGGQMWRRNDVLMKRRFPLTSFCGKTLSLSPPPWRPLRIYSVRPAVILKRSINKLRGRRKTNFQACKFSTTCPLLRTRHDGIVIFHGFCSGFALNIQHFASLKQRRFQIYVKKYHFLGRTSTESNHDNFCVACDA